MPLHVADTSSLFTHGLRTHFSQQRSLMVVPMATAGCCCQISSPLPIVPSAVRGSWLPLGLRSVRMKPLPGCCLGPKVLVGPMIRPALIVLVLSNCPMCLLQKVWNMYNFFIKGCTIVTMQNKAILVVEL